jgi:Ca2+-binding RTX toxin-like protein
MRIRLLALAGMALVGLLGPADALAGSSPGAQAYMQSGQIWVEAYPGWHNQLRLTRAPSGDAIEIRDIGTTGSYWVYGHDGCQSESDSVSTFASCPVTEAQFVSHQIYAYDGNDSVVVSAAIRVNIYGGLGDDVLTASGENFDVLNGEDGNDVLNGGAGADTLRGGPGNDVLNGGPDNDTLAGEAGVDTLNGEGNNDTLSGGPDADVFNGGPGAADRASYFGVVRDLFVTIDNIPNDGEGDNVKSDVEGVTGGGGNDTLEGWAASPHPETFSGGPGNDTINAKGGADQVFGEAGNDTIDPGDGADTVFGGADNDLVIASPGNDTLNGDDGVDNLNGGDGRDILDGGWGADSMSGGNGLADLVTYGSSNFGATRVENLTVTVDDQPNDGEAGEQDNVRLDVEQVQGGAGNDAIAGSNDAETLSGGGGNDLLQGGGGDDTLTGEAENDTLEGGAGDDALDGGGGLAFNAPDTDVLSGGLGSDSASYFRTAPVSVSLNNVADDGEAGENDNVKSDVEDVSGGTANDTLVGNGSANDFFGNAGADRIVGSGGSDELNGGRGNDNLNGGPGRDTLLGGPGNDALNSKDTSPDHDTCGSGADVVTRNASDFVANDCEIRR